MRSSAKNESRAIARNTRIPAIGKNASPAYRNDSVARCGTKWLHIIDTDAETPVPPRTEKRSRAKSVDCARGHTILYTPAAAIARNVGITKSGILRIIATSIGRCTSLLASIHAPHIAARSNATESGVSRIIRMRLRRELRENTMSVTSRPVSNSSTRMRSRTTTTTATKNATMNSADARSFSHIPPIATATRNIAKPYSTRAAAFCEPWNRRRMRWCRWSESAFIMPSPAAPHSSLCISARSERRTTARNV